MMLIEICIKNPDWGSDSPQIVRLWDMITFRLQPLCSQLCALQHAETGLQNLIESRPEIGNIVIDKGMKDRFDNNFSVMLESLDKIGLIASPKLLNRY